MDAATVDSLYLMPIIVAQAQGVFIWAELVIFKLIMALGSGTDRIKLDLALIALPAELTDLYGRIMSKISVENRHHTHNYLHYS